MVGVEDAGPGRAASVVLVSSLGGKCSRVGTELSWRPCLLSKLLTALVPSSVPWGTVGRRVSASFLGL